MPGWPPYGVAVAVALSCYDVFQQFQSRSAAVQDRLKNAVKEVVTSPVVSTESLIVYRLAVSTICIAVLWVQVLEHSLQKVMRYFTTWNFALLTLYFTFATLVTLCDWAFRKRGRRNKVLARLCRFLVVSFHIIVTTVWIVDLVTWFILWPVLERVLKDNPVKLANERAKLFNMSSYIEHGVNALFILGELSINNIGPDGHVSCWVCLWGLAYGFFAIAFFFSTGKWLYPMLDAAKPLSPLFYVGIHASTKGCFTLFRPLKARAEHMFHKPKNHLPRYPKTSKRF